MINHGIAPYFKAILKEKVTSSDVFVISFDESLNPVTQTCEMDMYIRFWNMEKNEVQIRYWGSSFLGHGCHQNLLHHFETLLRSWTSEICIRFQWMDPM